jgi:hypothetical protein
LNEPELIAGLRLRSSFSGRMLPPEVILKRSLIFSTVVVAVVGCSSTDDGGVSCGPGTVLQDGTCIPADSGVGDTSVRDSGTDTAKPDVTIDSGSDLGTDAKDAPDGTTDVMDAPESPADVADAADTPTDSAEDGSADTTPVTLPWTRHFGGTGDDHPLGVLANAAGETIVHGFSQSSSLDLGKGAITMPAGNPGFLAKIDPAGRTVWTKTYSVAGTGEINAATQAIDGTGNLFVGGGLYHTTSVSFGDGTLTAACAGSGGPGCAYVAKIDGGGKFVWAKAFAAGLTATQGIACDGTDVVLTGAVSGAIDFGLGSLPGGSSGTDVFVAKLDMGGTTLWAKRFNGGASGSAGLGVAVDTAGNVFLTGTFSGTIDFGGGPLVSAGGPDIYVAKFDKTGAHVWSKRFGDSRDRQSGMDLKADALGNVIVFGSLLGSANFGGGSLSSTGTVLADIFVAKFAPDGAHIWSKAFGGPGGASPGPPGSLVVDPSGSVLFTGIGGAIDFGGGLLKAGMYMTKLTATGTHVWSHHFGGGSSADYGYGTSLTLDPAGNAVILVGFFGTDDFDDGVFPGASFTSAGNQDVFLGKFLP